MHSIPQQPNHLNIAIIGAGATGVELAAQLVEAKENFYRYGLNHIHPDLVKITLIEAADRILPALPEKWPKIHYDKLKR